MDSDKKTMAKWVETWKRAGVALEKVKRRELRELENLIRHV